MNKECKERPQNSHKKTVPERIKRVCLFAELGKTQRGRTQPSTRHPPPARYLFRIVYPTPGYVAWKTQVQNLAQPASAKNKLSVAKR
jgi:hypothetical protein